MTLPDNGIGILSATLVLCTLVACTREDGLSVEDAWLDGKLDAVITLNEYLNPFEIDTDVTNGVAVISGEVDSEVERQLATELAKSIGGIDAVDNRLRVTLTKQSPGEQAVAEALDASITTSIVTKLLLNTDIDSADIDVATENKTVTLTGKVDSDAERALAQQIAANTFQVQSVENKLAVN